MTLSISSVRDTFQAASAALVQENITLTEKVSLYPFVDRKGLILVD